MIEVIAAVTIFAAAQDVIGADVSGSRRWRVALEGSGGAIAFLATTRTADTREVVLMTTAWLADRPGGTAVLSQRFFEHTIDCAALTQAQTGFGRTDPPPRRWTPADGPPLSRQVPVPAPVQPNTAMAIIAEAVCRDGAPDLIEIEGEWPEVSRALRQRVEASRAAAAEQ
ncbi:hypothetical protein [Brevundimonas sp. TWP2-3-4b2]|uniref:hypothetical protein n=1 Tax=Brevundimonas sp. TWP2-3-4b2 TaxID=2804595 RepID=UPI003CF0AFEC